MNARTAIGTIDRPLTRDPQKQASMPSSAEMASAIDTHAHVAGAAAGRRQNRTREMQLIPEALARAHMEQQLREAAAERPARRLVHARRMQRRAERASLRARRALAMVVMQ